MTRRLSDAVATLRYRQITALLDNGVDINGRTDGGRTPLMATLGIRDPEKRNHMFRFLVHHGADMLESDHDDVTIFQHCCNMGYLDLMQLILKKAGVNAINLFGSDKKGRTPLYHAVMSEDIEIVSTVLGYITVKQQSVDVPDDDGLTPLLYAKRHGLMEIAALLLEKGKANPRICDRHMHMNAEEWAAEARRRQRKEQTNAKKQARERYLIFPPIDHATKGKETVSKLKAKTISLPDLSSQDVQNTSFPQKSTLLGSSSSRFPILNSSKNNNISKNAMTHDNAVDFRTKSIDSAISLLGLASQAADEKEYALSFVSSSTYASINIGENKLSNAHHIRQNLSNIMDAYSVQNTSNFRRPARPPALQKIYQESNIPGNAGKMSTLAIILRTTRGGKNVKSPRGQHGKGRLRSVSKLSENGDHQSTGKLPKQRTTSLAPSDIDNKFKMASLPEMGEDESEFVSKTGKKERANSTRRKDKMPNITVS